MFDFNNQACLSITDIYYIMLTSLKSVFKVFKVNGFVNEDEVFRFVGENLVDVPKINVSIMIK